MNVINFLRIALVLPFLIGTSSAVQATPSLRYKLTYTIKLNMSKRVDETYMLDHYDIDGDGADDFAVSGMSTGGAFFSGKPKPGPLVHSFLVRNDPVRKKLIPLDLGLDGLTNRTWAGLFYRNPANGHLFFILGRNGELGLPGYNPGERVSIFAIQSEDGALTARSVFQSDWHSTTVNISACDIDSDGIDEIYINSYGTPDDMKGAPLIVQIDAKDSIWEGLAKRWVPSLVEGPANAINLVDINGDGRCDLLAAYEVTRWGKDPKETKNTFPGVNASYAILNTGKKIDGEMIKVPTPRFGDQSSAGDFIMMKQGDRELGFVVSSYFPSFSKGLIGTYVQVYSFANGKFTDVTSSVLDGQLPEKYHHQDIHFADIDHDGDLDVYLGSYEGAVVIYRNDDGKFSRQTVLRDDGENRAVVFLANDKTKCDDLVVLNHHQTLRRYTCR